MRQSYRRGCRVTHRLTGQLPAERRNPAPWLRSGSFGEASPLAGRVMGQTWAVNAMPGVIERLLTADVAREIARAYGDRPIYPEQIVIDSPGRGPREFPGWPGPVLVLADENQGGCSWGVPLNGAHVLVGGERTTVTYASIGRGFRRRPAMGQPVRQLRVLVAAQAAPLDEASFSYLRARCTPSVTTKGCSAPGSAGSSIRMCGSCVVGTGQCDWLISAATEVSLRRFAAGLAGLPSLAAARWAAKRKASLLLGG